MRLFCREVTMKHWFCISVFILCLNGLSYQADSHPELDPPEVPSIWNRTDYPHPRDQPHRCGRRGHFTNICDPNHLIKFIEGKILCIYNRIIKFRLQKVYPCRDGYLLEIGTHKLSVIVNLMVATYLYQ